MQSKRQPEYSACHPPNPNRVFSAHELSFYDGRNENGPIYMGVLGKVYDVTTGACALTPGFLYVRNLHAGEDYYGPGGPYQELAGRDCSRALARMEAADMVRCVAPRAPRALI